jgi:tRNA modification GTPase
MNSSDTIVAISSAVGAAARMIVRVSGAGAHAIARGLVAGGSADEISGGAAFCARVWPGVLAWVYWFVGPKSYTGEDLVELHIPGNAVLARMLLEEIVRRGARQAEAGEFTARAYFNGRMDLTQAEGVAATISAHSEREMRAARQLLGGELARRLGPVMESVAEALALVEVGIDFSDEDVTFLSAEQVRERCENARRALDGILSESSRFERLSHEPRIVLIGRPNAGKSTLLNSLAKTERAVVSAVAGTTRDAIWAEVRLARGMVRVVDVAGIEEVGSGQLAVGSVEAEIARKMHEQAMKAVGGADIVVWVEECLSAGERMELGRGVDLVVRTKVDLMGEVDKNLKTEETDKNVRPTDFLLVSAKTGAGMESLRGQLDRLAFGTEAGVGLALNARHEAAMDEGRLALLRAVDAVEAGAELVAMELREVLDALGSVLGKISPDELLGRVFSRFCIGK